MRAMVIGKVRIRKFWHFSSNEIWKIIGCLISDTKFGLRWSRLKYKWKKSKRNNMRVKVDLYNIFEGQFCATPNTMGG